MEMATHGGVNVVFGGGDDVKNFAGTFVVWISVFGQHTVCRLCGELTPPWVAISIKTTTEG
jgi:hypothetical protein